MAGEITLETQIPAKLVAEMEALVEAGWFRDRDTLLTEALRRYLESHRPQLLERFARDDVAWGLGERE